MRKKRKFYRGQVNHVYQRSINGVNLFYGWEDFIVFYTIFAVCARSSGIQVLELCIMPNHFHILIRTSSVHELSSFMDRFTSWYVMEYNAESPAAPKYIHIAKAMGVNTEGMTESEGVKAAVEAVKQLSLSIGIPQKLNEIGVRKEDLHTLAVDAFNDVCTGGNPRPTSIEDIEALYNLAY